MPAPIVVLEGIDGAGKTTSLDAIQTFLRQHHQAELFDSIAFEKAHGRLPRLKELDPKQQILCTGEPTYSGFGREIRRRLMLRADDPDSLTDRLEQAEMFAADRSELYRKLVLPFLKAGGKHVVQSRGLLSSLVYQGPALAHDLNISIDKVLEILLTLPGNILEARYAPELLIIMDIPPTEAAKRLKGRSGTMDMFEADLMLQTQIRDRYLEPRFQAPYREAGTAIQIISADAPREEVRANTFAVLESFYRAV